MSHNNSPLNETMIILLTYNNNNDNKKSFIYFYKIKAMTFNLNILISFPTGQFFLYKNEFLFLFVHSFAKKMEWKLHERLFLNAFFHFFI